MTTTEETLETDRAKHLPTPAEIAAACRAIQAGWSDRERRYRAGLPDYEPYTVPRVRSEAAVLDE